MLIQQSKEVGAVFAKLKNSTALGEKLWFAALWLQFFFIICMTMPFNQGLAGRLIKCVMLLSIGLCCIKILLIDQMSAKALGVSAVVLFLCAVSALIARQLLFLGLMALVISCRDISFQRIIGHYASFCVVYIVLTLLLFALGYLHSSTFGIRYSIGFLKIRCYDLGFTHYNYAAMWFFLAVQCLTMAVPQKHKGAANLLGICIMSIVFLITASRTTYLLSLFTFAALFIRQYHPRALGRSSNYRLISALLILGMITAMFFLAYVYSPQNPLLVLINKLLSWRLAFSQFYLKPGMLFLFGNPSNYSGPILDYMYLYIAFRFGIVAMLIYIGIQIYAADRCIRAGRLDLWIIAIIFVAYSLYEKSLQSCITMMLYPAFAKLDTEQDAG